MKIFIEFLRLNLINELVSNYKCLVFLLCDFLYVIKIIFRNYGSKCLCNIFYCVKFYVMIFLFIFLLYKIIFKYEMNKIIVLVFVMDVFV